MIARLWLRLMARLFGPRVEPPQPVARSVGTGPFLQGGSVHHAKRSDPPAKLFYDLAASAAEDGEFEAAATYLIEASRRDR